MVLYYRKEVKGVEDWVLKTHPPCPTWKRLILMTVEIAPALQTCKANTAN